jgi:xylulokinase
MDEGGQPLSVAEQSYATSHPHPGWSEQDPADWITALEAAIVRLRDEHPAFSQIRGIGVAGHMHGAVVLDAIHNMVRAGLLRARAGEGCG